MSTLAVGVLACEPKVDSGLSAVGVAIATDRAGSRALAGHGVEVRWLTCKADVQPGGRSPEARPYAMVDCEGRTESGDDIRLHGRVTEERSGPCIHGDLTAEVDGRTIFRAEWLGACGRSPSVSEPPASVDEVVPGPQFTGAGSSPLAPEPGPTVIETVTVPPWSEPRPTVTETVTVPPRSEPRPTVTETVTVSPDPSGDASDEPTGDPRATETPTETPTADPSPSGSPSPEPSPGSSRPEPEPRPSDSAATAPERGGD